MGERAQDVIARYESKKSDSSTWRNHMADIAELTRPLRAELRGEKQQDGKRYQNVYDSTAIIAAQRLGANFNGTAASPAETWFEIGTDDPDFNAWPRARTALNLYSLRTLASFGTSYSNFYGESFPYYLDFVCFGEGYFYSERRPDRSGFMDRCMPLSECEFGIDREGRVNEFYWCTDMAIAEAARDFGEQALSSKLQDMLKKNPYQKVPFLHAVMPNDAYSPAHALDPRRGKPWLSVHVEADTKHEIEVSGYRDMPYYVVPWERAAGEHHARGAGEMNLGDNRSSQVMGKANLAAGEWAANPPWGSKDDINLRRMAPGRHIPGAINARGEQLVQALYRGTNAPFSLEMTKDLRENIREGFFWSLLNTQSRTGIGTEEFLNFRDERFRAMAPYLSNEQIYRLRPLVERRFRYLVEEGVFRDVVVPRELAGRTLQVTFVSPMALAQKAAKASSAIRATSAIGAAAQLDRKVIDRFNGDAFCKIVTDGFGVSNLIFDDEETAANRKARTEAEAQQANIIAAQGMADAAHKGAGAMAQMRGGQQ